MTMEAKIRPWLLWVLLAVVLIGGGFTYWYLNSDETNTSISPSPTLTKTATTTPSANTTTDWKTYTNDAYGYSIKYPSDYSVKEWADTIKTGAAAEPNKNLLSVIGFGKNSKLGDYEVSITVTNDTLERRRTLACYELNTDRNETQVTVGGIQAYKITCKDAAAPNDMAPDAQRQGGEKNINFVFQRGEYVYIISYIQDVLTKDTSSTFEDAVSTFQFTQ